MYARGFTQTRRRDDDDERRDDRGERVSQIELGGLASTFFLSLVGDIVRACGLYDQSAFSSYYGDEELQAEATRVVRTAAMR